jgi:hypothetical protein
MAVNISTHLEPKQVLKIAGRGTHFIDYPDLNAIESLFQLPSKLVVFYNHKVDQNLDVIGHYCALLRHPKYIEFFDAYNYKPDDILIAKTSQQRMETGQQTNQLCRLLYDSGLPVVYNEHSFQSSKPSVATCGDWTGIRCRFSSVPLNEFQQLFIDVKPKVDLDELITALANQYIGS